MDRKIFMLLIGLVFGGGIGFLVAAGNGITLDGHDHATGHGGGGHDHGAMVPIVLAAGDTAPTLTAAVLKDPASGWNLHIETTNFRFAPENASTDHVAGEGHAHVYVDGVKLARVYADWYHIDHLPEGISMVEVVLNSNNHSPLAVDNIPLKASVKVENLND
jgi:hypothetical protein